MFSEEEELPDGERTFSLFFVFAVPNSPNRLVFFSFPSLSLFNSQPQALPATTFGRPWCLWQGIVAGSIDSLVDYATLGPHRAKARRQEAVRAKVHKQGKVHQDEGRTQYHPGITYSCGVGLTTLCRSESCWRRSRTSSLSTCNSPSRMTRTCSCMCPRSGGGGEGIANMRCAQGS